MICRRPEESARGAESRHAANRTLAATAPIASVGQRRRRPATIFFTTRSRQRGRVIHTPQDFILTQRGDEKFETIKEVWSDLRV